MSDDPGQDEESETMRFTAPQTGVVILFGECDLKALKEEIEKTITGFYFPNLGKPVPADEIKKRVEHAFDYTVRNLKQVVNAALMRVCGEAIDVSSRAAGKTRGGRLTVHKALLHEEEKEAKARLGLKPRGQKSKWNKNELARAIIEALGTLRPEDRTYEHVCSVLKEKYPDKAPKTIGALKKLLPRHGLVWKALKVTLK
jgi:hypothetical protein